MDKLFKNIWIEIYAGIKVTPLNSELIDNLDKLALQRAYNEGFSHSFPIYKTADYPGMYDEKIP